MNKGILKKLSKVRDACNEDENGGCFSGEGYHGGYRDALTDVEFMLKGYSPPDKRGWWKEIQQPPEINN